MNVNCRLTRLTLATALAAGLAGCNHLEDNVTQYTQRTNGITVSGGNAKDANAAIHIIDPWPRASANRRIPANGHRMADAYERYRNVEKPAPRVMITPPTVVQSTSGAATSTAK